MQNQPDHSKYFSSDSSRVLVRLLFFILILLSFRSSRAGIIDTVIIPSKVMNIQPRALIILPQNYSLDQEIYFPSLYLLHGWSGSFLDWNNHTDLRMMADRYKIVIICPDGGYDGWYLDSPNKNESLYETYIINEVIPFIQTHYRTDAGAKKRFICGLSMGGYGALRFIARHPDLFAAAGSMSGVLQFNSKLDRYGLVELLGDSLSNSRVWKENDLSTLVVNLIGKSKGLILDCGIDDPFIEMNRAIHYHLMNIGVEHEYLERPGSHTWTYWTIAIEYHLLYFQKLLQHQN